jgi:hypothetical protein
MNLLIKSLSASTTQLAIKTRDLFEETSFETVILVPHGLQEILIFEEELVGEYIVSLWGDKEELDIVEGFQDLEYAQKYAKAVAKESGLTENDILLITEKLYFWMGFKSKSM